MQAYEHAAAYHRVLVQDVKYLSSAHRRRVNRKQGEVVDAFAAAIVGVAPQLERDALLKPVTMTLFGMINWTFTWLKDRGPVTYAQMAPVVSALFLGGVGSIAATRSRRGAARANGHALLNAQIGATTRRRSTALPPPPVPAQLPQRAVRRPARRPSIKESS
jgi:hypothetical protein